DLVVVRQHDRNAAALHPAGVVVHRESVDRPGNRRIEPTWEESTMSFRTADAVVPSVDPPRASTTPETNETGLEESAVTEALRVIQKHIDKEARNRWVEHLDVRDLCPRQKADPVADLARLS